MRAHEIPRLTWDASGALEFRFSYNPMMVADLKATIPSSARRWNAAQRCWQVTPQYQQACIDIAQRHTGIYMQLPIGAPPAPRTETRLLDVRYIGTTKDRGDGQPRSAYGWCEGEWRVLLTERVLQAWFGGDIDDTPEQPASSATLYGVLGIARTAANDDLRKAYRRLALQWHPDVSKEPGSEDMFKRIQHAYEVLRDGGLRARYDAGLLLEATMQVSAQQRAQSAAAMAAVTVGYRSPLRCGLLLAEGVEQLGRFVVARIMAWEDIPGPNGTVLCTSWPAGAQTFEEAWI